jgi:hypothetical protein
VDVPAGFLAGWDDDDCRRHFRRAARVGDLLADDGLIAGKDWRQQVLVLRVLRRRRLSGEREDKGKDESERDRQDRGSDMGKPSKKRRRSPLHE